MYVGMGDCLSGGLAVVYADTETVRGQLIRKSQTNLSDQFPDLRLIGIREGKDAGNVLSRDDQSVTFCNREHIAEGNCQGVVSYNAIPKIIAKRAVCCHGGLFSKRSLG